MVPLRRWFKPLRSSSGRSQIRKASAPRGQMSPGEGISRQSASGVEDAVVCPFVMRSRAFIYTINHWWIATRVTAAEAGCRSRCYLASERANRRDRDADLALLPAGDDVLPSRPRTSATWWSVQGWQSGTGRFVALHLLGLHPEARSQVLLLRAFRNPGLDERVRDAREAGVPQDGDVAGLRLLYASSSRRRSSICSAGLDFGLPDACVHAGAWRRVLQTCQSLANLSACAWPTMY